MDRLLFGKEFVRVHHEKDVYAKVLGPSHRRIAHDPLSNLIIAVTQYPDDPLRAFLSAQVHDSIDWADTTLKRSRNSPKKHGKSRKDVPSMWKELLKLAVTK